MTSRPTRAEIDALLKRASELPLPLSVDCERHGDGCVDWKVVSQDVDGRDTGECYADEGLARYLCAAANLAPSLAARVVELTEALESIGCIHPMAGRKVGTTCISLCFSRANYCGVCDALSEKP